MKNDSILRLPQVIKIVGLSLSTIYRLEREGNFPRRRKIAERNTGWLKSEIQEWIKSCPLNNENVEP